MFMGPVLIRRMELDIFELLIYVDIIKLMPSMIEFNMISYPFHSSPSEMSICYLMDMVR